MMLEVDDPLMAPGVNADPHDQAPLRRFDLQLVRLGMQPRHPNLVAVTQISNLGITVPGWRGSAPA